MDDWSIAHLLQALEGTSKSYLPPQPGISLTADSSIYIYIFGDESKRLIPAINHPKNQSQVFQRSYKEFRITWMYASNLLEGWDGLSPGQNQSRVPDLEERVMILIRLSPSYPYILAGDSVRQNNWILEQQCFNLAVMCQNSRQQAKCDFPVLIRDLIQLITVSRINMLPLSVDVNSLLKPKIQASELCQLAWIQRRGQNTIQIPASHLAMHQ